MAFGNNIAEESLFGDSLVLWTWWGTIRHCINECRLRALDETKQILLQNSVLQNMLILVAFSHSLHVYIQDHRRPEYL